MQFNDPTRVGPAIQNVADDDEVGVTTRPTQCIVDDRSALQCLDHGAVGAVNVTDRDDTFDVIILPLFSERWLHKCGQRKQQHADFCERSSQVD